MNGDYDLSIVYWLQRIAEEFKRFNDRQEGNMVQVPEGWSMDYPIDKSTLK